MAWVKLDDGYFEHPKIIEAASAGGPGAPLLDLAAIAWATRNHTDGFIPRQVIHRLVPGVGLKASSSATRGLLKVGRWTARQDGSGYDIHDFLDYNLDAQTRRSRAKANAERQQRYRDRNSGRYALRDAQRNATPIPRPTPLQGCGGSDSHPETPPAGENGARALDGRDPAPAGDEPRKYTPQQSAELFAQLDAYRSQHRTEHHGGGAA